MGKSLDRDDRAIKKIDLWDWIVALYILAIYVFENAQYSMLFSLIQLSFFAYTGLQLVECKKIPLNPCVQWLACLTGLSIVLMCFNFNDYTLDTTVVIVKNCLKCLCFSLYIYKKRNVDFLLLCIGLSGAVCGVFLLMRFTESNMVYDNLRYATSNRIGADIAGGNVNVVAMNMCFAFSAWLYLTQSEKAIRRKIIMYGMLIFVVATSLLTGARKILAFYVIAFFFANSGMKFRNKVLIVIGFGLLYAALIYVEPLYYLVGHKLNILGNESSHGMYAESDNTRKNLVIGALNLFTQNPLGYGYGGVTYHLGMYSHNNYTEVLASGGLLGFVCYYALYVRSLFVSYKMRKDLFCKFCWYTLLGVMALEIGQITVTNPMPYVFYALLGGMEYRTVNDA